MIVHEVRAHKEKERLPREQQLAWKIAEVAADPVAVDADVAEMIGSRIIDNASVASASLNRHPVMTARAQAEAHTRKDGAAVLGLPATRRFESEWAAWANGVAVRELDFHDTFLAAEYSHPGDNIPPILAVAQALGKSGRDLIRAIATGYEIQVALVKGICLHEHKIDHVAHLGPSAAAGIGTLLNLPVETIYQAVQQGLHVTTATRQSRKGEISSWKAFAPAHAGKLAIEAVDRAMRGEGAPSPIYEGEDGVIAWMLGGWDARYHVPLPAKGEPKRQILDTYTKQHSAEYQSQAPIDLARKLGREIAEVTGGEWDRVEDILFRTSHHTHYVIGTGANDPQKMDPKASRETLDHSIMYILAVALQDQAWHHVRSYAPERAQRPDTVRLWHKIRTEEDKRWTERYHTKNPSKLAFGGELIVTLDDGTVIKDEIALADAHPHGAHPFKRPQYIDKFRALAEDIVDGAEQERFLGAVARLHDLGAGELGELNVAAAPGKLKENPAKGIF